jgi:hypothetical protein
VKQINQFMAGQGQSVIKQNLPVFAWNFTGIAGII